MKCALWLFALAPFATLQAADQISADVAGVRAQISADGQIAVDIGDVDGKPLVSIENSRQEGHYDCAGRHVSISGKHNQLVLTGECPFVDVSGDENKVVIDRLGELSVAGDGNTVLWREGIGGIAPQVGDDGEDNQLQVEPSR